MVRTYYSAKSNNRVIPSVNDDYVTSSEQSIGYNDAADELLGATTTSTATTNTSSISNSIVSLPTVAANSVEQSLNTIRPPIVNQIIVSPQPHSPSPSSSYLLQQPLSIAHLQQLANLLGPYLLAATANQQHLSEHHQHPHATTTIHQPSSSLPHIDQQHLPQASSSSSSSVSNQSSNHRRLISENRASKITQMYPPHRVSNDDDAPWAFGNPQPKNGIRGTAGWMSGNTTTLYRTKSQPAIQSQRQAYVMELARQRQLLINNDQYRPQRDNYYDADRTPMRFGTESIPIMIDDRYRSAQRSNGISNNESDKEQHKMDLLQQIEDNKRSRLLEKQREQLEDERERRRMQEYNARIEAEINEERRKERARYANKERKAAAEVVDNQSKQQHRHTDNNQHQTKRSNSIDHQSRNQLEWWERQPNSAEIAQRRHSIHDEKQQQSLSSVSASVRPSSIFSGRTSRNGYKPSSATSSHRHRDDDDDEMMRQMSAMRQRLTKEQIRMRSAIRRNGHDETMNDDADDQSMIILPPMIHQSSAAAIGTDNRNMINSRRSNQQQSMINDRYN